MCGKTKTLKIANLVFGDRLKAYDSAFHLLTIITVVMAHISNLHAIPRCGLDIMFLLTGLPSLQRWIEEAGARLQFHLSSVFCGCPLQFLQQHSPTPPWSAGLLLPRLPRNNTWINYMKWVTNMVDKASSSIRPPIQKFIPLINIG